MSLFQKTTINNDLAKTSKLIYGFPKTGKTTFCSFMQSKDGKPPLFITTEDGHSALEIYAQRVTSWDGFEKLINHLENNKEQLLKEHSCFVIDIISDLDLWLVRKICNDFKAMHIYDDRVFPFGKGTSIHKNLFQNAIQRLFAILPITFVAHSKEKEIIWDGEKIKTQAPSLSAGVMEFINGKVDIIGWISPSRNKNQAPKVIMKASDTCIAGSRYKQLVREFGFDPDNPGKTYSEMQSAFEKTTI